MNPNRARPATIQTALANAVLPRLRPSEPAPRIRTIAAALGISVKNAGKHMCRMLAAHDVETRRGQRGRIVVRVGGRNGNG